MIEIILKRKPIRDFLKNYSSERWNEIIPNVLEIGVLNLKNSFGTYQFSQEDFESILYDLHNSNQKPVSKENKTPRKKNNHHSHKKHIYKNEETYNEEKKEYNNYKQINKNYNEQTSQHKPTFCDKKSSRSNTEVFITKEQDFQKKNRMNSYNNRKQNYHINQDTIKRKNDENKKNIAYTGSKIKKQVINGKLINKVIKENKPINNNQYQTNCGNNYKINYDKNLQPESIYDKENQMYYYDIKDDANYDKYNYNYPSDNSYREIHGNKLNYCYNDFNNNDVLDNNNCFKYQDNVENNYRNDSDFHKCCCCSRNNFYSPCRCFHKNPFSMRTNCNFNNTTNEHIWNENNKRIPLTNYLNIYKTTNYENEENGNNFNNMTNQDIITKKDISKINSKSDLNYTNNKNDNKNKSNDNHQKVVEQNNEKLDVSKDSEEQLTSSQRLKFLFKREVVNWNSKLINDESDTKSE